MLIRHELIPATFNASEQVLLPLAGSHSDIPKSFIPMLSLVLKTEDKQEQNIHDFMRWQQMHLAESHYGDDEAARQPLD